MSTPSDDRLAYVNLARQRAHVQRRLPADALVRLAEVAVGRGEVEIELRFLLDGSGRPRVRGRAVQPVESVCQRCLESFVHSLAVEFDLCIVREGAAATEIAERSDVLVVDGETVAVNEIVEDEMLLGLPDRLCTTDPCPHAPLLAYPAADGEGDDGSSEAVSPFSVLSKLKRADS